ncbi:MAG TPA: hypothetical protein VNR18_09675, partial [Hyphomicrobiales bacterium]|nr:hypothetical protein [Hyphomicrobiales bacterium]
RSKLITIARASKRKGSKRPRWGNKRQAVTVQVRKGGGRRPVAARISATGAKHSAGFIVTGANGNRHVFYRRGSSRMDIAAAHTWSIPEMVINAAGRAGSLQDYYEFMNDTLDLEFGQAMEHLLGLESNDPPDTGPVEPG